MKRLQLNQLLKASAAFASVSAVTVDAWLYILDAGGIVNARPEWYINAPIVAWGVVGIPTTIALTERLISTAIEKPGKIQPLTAPGDNVRAIPLTRNGQKSTLFASAARWALGETSTQSPAPPRVTGWRVPVAGDYITISEKELTRFLELASRRKSYQFSRRYWTERRRPPMPLVRYNALMELLTQAGLIEARTVGASGWLRGNIRPHNAVTFLKYESQFKLA